MQIFTARLNESFLGPDPIVNVTKDVHRFLVASPRLKDLVRIATIEAFKQNHQNLEASLNIAVNNKIVSLARFFVECGANVNLRVRINRETFNYAEIPIHIAVENKDIPMLEFLKSLPEINVNIQDPMFLNTPLHRAAELNNLQMVCILLNHQKIDPFLQNFTGNTALHSAIQCEMWDLITMQKAKSHDFENHKFLTKRNIFKIVKIMTKISPKLVNVKNCLGQTPLELAISLNHFSEYHLLHRQLESVINWLQREAF